MSREWKPGDVAVVGSLGEDRTCSWATDCPVQVHPKGPHWHVLNSGRYLGADADVFRPLVVIDPEDAEQLERIAAAYHECDGAVLDNAQPMTPRALALRHALTAPPKLAEPQGLGAVVEDAHGVRHVQISMVVLNRWRSEGDGTSRRWDLVNAVRLLSDGVTA